MTTNYNRSTVDSLLTDLYWTRTQSDNNKVDKPKIDQYMYYLCTKSLKIALKYLLLYLTLINTILNRTLYFTTWYRTKFSAQRFTT